MTKLTPMMSQYQAMKAQHPDCVLLFRLGDFYELFFDEAKEISALLNLALTARHGVPMCGMPFHAVDNYISRLTKAGKKVAICEQLSDPNLPGIVERGVIRVITPGTTFDERVVDQKSNRYLAAFSSLGEQWALALCDATTGEFRVSEFSSETAFHEELSRIRPVELIHDSSDSFTNSIGEIDQCAVFSHSFSDDPADFLCHHFGVKTLESFGLDDKPVAVKSAALLLSYLKETQKSDMRHVETLRWYGADDSMVLDVATIQNLELFETLREAKKEGSLWWVMDHTKTAMGGRLLRSWMLNPLLDRAKICERLETVDFLINETQKASELGEVLKNMLDVERLMGRLGIGTAHGRDLMALRQSLRLMPLLKNLLSGTLPELLQNVSSELESLAELEKLLLLLENGIIDEPPLTLREGGIIRDGFSEELDGLRTLTREGKGYLQKLQEREIARTGISSLKVRYNQVFGYYLEITKSNLHLVPEDYMRKQTLVNAERFITPELKEYEEKILTAQEKINGLEYRLFSEIRDEVAKHMSAIQKFARAAATVDAVLSLSEAARKYGYCKPNILNQKQAVIRVKNSRHPVVERLEMAKFVPNDVSLNPERRCLLITGPNMGGKSIYLRQVALIQLLAQIGSFVPAESAEMTLVDRIFTRIGASDSLVKGQSTFMVEMSETAYILRNATERSLVLLDEIGRGTSTYDGMSLAWAILEFLHDRVKAFTLFASHYHELIAVAEKLECAKNVSVAVKETKSAAGEKGIVFLYKVVEGAVDRSYGIEVAKLAGLPRDVIEKSINLLRDLEEGVIDQKIQETASRPKIDEHQTNLFTDRKHRVLEEIEKIDPATMTPLEALTKIDEWKRL